MPATDLSLLIDAARAAGAVAQRFTGPEARVWHKPDDLGPVTEADLAVNELLAERLRQARPDYGWLSEESEDSADRLDCAQVFVVDPIDGTRSFIEGSNTWAHSLAVVEAGEVTAAVVYLPAADKLYAAARGVGATLNGTPIKASNRSKISGASVLAARPNYARQHWRDEEVPDFVRAYRPSLAYRLSLVAEGRYDAMLTLRDSWEWDIAAGALILSEAGAQVTDTRGAPLLFNNPTPKVKGVVAAAPALHREIATRLAPRP